VALNLTGYQRRRFGDCLTVPPCDYGVRKNSKTDAKKNAGEVASCSWGDYGRSVASLKHARQVHLYSGTPGRTVWAQSRQMNRPSL
jgi:hypothetical protein